MQQSKYGKHPTRVELRHHFAHQRGDVSVRYRGICTLHACSFEFLLDRVAVVTWLPPDRRRPSAEIVTGPWTPLRKIYRPPESDGTDPFVYAGKAHPELKGADLIMTSGAADSSPPKRFDAQDTLGCAPPVVIK
jgi:hypothetical protein